MSSRPSDAESIRSDLKIIVIGTSGTGKTSYVNKWTKNIFNEEYKATIVSEFGFKVFEHEGKLYRIQLWDLAGQDKNSTVTKIFAKDSHGCIIVSDATKPSSLNE
jgi:small GTP-binding protein